MGADSLAKNNPNAPEFICPICLPKPTMKNVSLGVHIPCNMHKLWLKISLFSKVIHPKWYKQCYTLWHNQLIVYLPIQEIFLDFQYQGGVESTVLGVFEDRTKTFPGTNLLANFKLKTLKYPSRIVTLCENGCHFVSFSACNDSYFLLSLK